MLDIGKFTDNYKTRRLSVLDIPEILQLEEGNREYYAMNPSRPNMESVLQSMDNLPPGKILDEKYYVGYYEDNRLIAIMDMIEAFPDNDTAFISFFMVRHELQGNGIGTTIVDDLFEYLKAHGYSRVDLSWKEWNHRSERFWEGIGFTVNGIAHGDENYTVKIADKLI